MSSGRSHQEHTESSAEKKSDSEEDDDKLSSLDRIMDIELLYLIYKGGSSGYKLRRDMQRLFRRKISNGIIYPHLRDYEKRGLIIESWSMTLSGRFNKKNYKITDKGPATLKKYVSELAIIRDEEVE